MDRLQLHTHWDLDVTLVPNRFLDEYMLRANGEFVKIYLYLLRSAPGGLPSLSLLADRMDCTERDILRAVRYWEKEGLMSLSFDDKQELTGISFSYPQEKSEAAAPKVPEATESTEPCGDAAPDPDGNCLTAERVKELKENEEVAQLLYIAEQYLKHPLSLTDTSKLLYFYEELNFSLEVIEFLIEYCVSKNHTNIRYMEKIALSWAAQEISTVAAAKEETRRYNQTYFTVFKALGMYDRIPTEGEIEIIDRWMQDWGFSMELILEACKRTIVQTGKGTVGYADSIVTNWHKANVRDFSDIKKLDAKHEKAKQAAPPAVRKYAKPNRFNDYPHRDYDFDQIKKSMFQQ